MEEEGWEVVPNDGFLEIQDDYDDLEEDGKKIFSRKFGIGPNNVFKNYFICPSSKPSSHQFVDSTTITDLTRLPKQLVPIPIHLDPLADDDDQKFLKQINISPSTIPEKIETPATIIDLPKEAADQDQDPVSQVSFKKKKEPEFVEMKMDSPRSNNNNNNRGIKSTSQIDGGKIQFDDDTYKGDSLISSPKFKPGEEEQMISKDDHPEVKKKVVTWEEEEEEENSGGISIWKWSLTGIGAICSFGVAAATVCIIILSGRQKNRQHHQDNNHKLQFHIYGDDKRLKQVVHHATKLNEAISAVRGVPITRAHITVGGYYDGL